MFVKEHSIQSKEKKIKICWRFKIYIIVSEIVSEINYYFNSSISFVTCQYPRCVDFSAHFNTTCNR